MENEKNCEHVANEKSQDPSIVVFWGSQGGTAETFASRFASDAISRFSPVFSMTADLADYDHEHLDRIPEHAVVVFMIATFGEGDPTDNAAAFMEHLRSRKAQNQRLDKLRFSIFGLGDSGYLHFNRAAKSVDQLLTELGAKRVGPLGLGDDCKGATEEDFIAWKAQVFESLSQTLSLKEADQTYKPRVNVETVQKPAALDDVYLGEPHCDYLPGRTAQKTVTDPSTAPLMLPVTVSHELCQNGNRNILHMEFSLDEAARAKYETGDYLEIWPINPDYEVNTILQLLGLWERRNAVVSITPNNNLPSSSQKSSSIFPTTPTTIDSLFRYYLDICGPVSREFLLGIFQFVSFESAASKEFFDSLCRDANRYQSEVTLPHLKLADLLQSLVPPEDTGATGVNQGCLSIPLSYFVEHLKRLKPRRYSIASSSVVQPRRIAISALVLNKEIPEKNSTIATPRPFHGVTTNYLLQLHQSRWHDGSSAENCNPNQQKQSPTYTPPPTRKTLPPQPTTVYAQIRPTKFKLPTNPATPITMISTGTGIAPFRAFIQERAQQKLNLDLDLNHDTSQPAPAQIGKTILFTGHRTAEEDFLYHQEWHAARKVLGDERFVVHTAFSRCAEARRRCYVQDVVQERFGDVLGVLDGGGVLYICGSSAMAMGVKDVLRDGWGRFSTRKSDADGWLRELKRSGRLMEDTWG